MLLWLWCRPAATPPIQPLGWEPPYAKGAALEMAKRQKKNLIISFSQCTVNLGHGIILGIECWFLLNVGSALAIATSHAALD